MSTSPVSGAAPSSSPAPQGQSSVQASLDALSNPDTFLQLLVAQLKNQDPLNPADGTQFVTQLATFAGVQQQQQMRTDLDSIDQIAKYLSAAQAAAATAQPAGNSN